MLFFSLLTISALSQSTCFTSAFNAAMTSGACTGNATCAYQIALSRCQPAGASLEPQCAQQCLMRGQGQDCIQACENQHE